MEPAWWRTRLLAGVGIALLGAASPALAQRTGTENGEWRYWGGDEGSTRYSPLAQIDAGNVATLEVAWRNRRRT